jgi:hypothetical protein
MRTSLVFAAAALLGSVSAQAAASPVQPLAAANRLAANVHPAALRLKGPPLRDARPRYYSIHATFGGLFYQGGQQYTVTGDGYFWPATVGDQAGVKYTVSMTAFTDGYPWKTFDFGELSGEGPFEDPSAQDLTFRILGTTNGMGYRLDVAGVLSNGNVQGNFEVSGNGGDGGGNFYSH